MARLDKTIQDYQKQLRNKGIKDIPEFVQSIVDADLTKGKYSRFLLDCYLSDKFREEDLKGGLESTVGIAITLFHKHKSKLPEEQRSIYKYGSPGDLWNVVKQFDGELSGKEIKREEQDRIYGETEFVYEDNEIGLKIISPLTIESAKWWGKGTRWCTSAEKNNQFKNYSSKAPLLILLMPGGEKLQLWKGENYNQFMDEADNEVSLDYIEKHWDILEPIMGWLKDLQWFPQKYITEELCKLAVQSNGLALEYISEDMKTEEICELAVQQIGDALQYVPDHMRTEELCRIAVQNSGNTILHIPKEFESEELYKIAVQQDGWTLLYVPMDMRTEELCKLAVGNLGYSLEFVPLNMKTEELCKLAVENDGISLEYVPTSFKTKELCKLAIEQDGDALEFVPFDMLSKELFQLAIENDGRALKHIPKNMRTREFCEIAVKQNKLALYNVPEELQEEMKQYIPPEIIEIPQDKYQQVFSEIRSLFPENTQSLTL